MFKFGKRQKEAIDFLKSRSILLLSCRKRNAKKHDSRLNIGKDAVEKIMFNVRCHISVAFKELIILLDNNEFLKR